MSAAPAVPTRAALARTTFSTSRLLEFCSRKELVAQTGHPVEEWPQVVLKELIDNALDNCEESGVAPFVAIEVRDGNDAAAIRITTMAAAFRRQPSSDCSTSASG